MRNKTATTGVQPSQPFIWLCLYLIIIALVTLFACPVYAADPRPLSPDPWSERAYGISLRPPTESVLQTQTADDFLLRGADELGGFTFTLQVKQSARVLTLGEVVALAKRQLQNDLRGADLNEAADGALLAKTNSRVLKEEMRQVGERPGAVLVISKQIDRTRQEVISLGMFEINPRTYGFLEFRCSGLEAEWVRPTFESVVGSIEVVDPQQLNAEREAALKRGMAWRSELSLKMIHDALVPERWFRIVADGQDTGYMLVNQKRVGLQGKAGVSVEVKTRLVQGNNFADSLGQFFLADDDSMEVWSVKTTLRPMAANAREQTWVDTGVRSGGKIQITSEASVGEHRRSMEFEVPPGYLSQVESWMLPQLLPIDGELDFGFYCYKPQDKQLSYRTDRVVPLLGGFVVVSRHSPNEQAYEASFDADRKMIESELGPTQKLLPAGASEIRRLWAGRMGR